MLENYKYSTNKARFARDRAAPGWAPLSGVTSIDPIERYNSLDLASEAPILKLILRIRLLIKDLPDFLV